jgi:hypothetical protein
MRKALQNPATVISLTGTLLGILMLASEESTILGALWWVAFTLSPLLLTALIAAYCRKLWPQLILSIASLGYFGWFTITYMDVFYWHRSPDSGWGLLTVGVNSLPFMIPAWLIALLARIFVRPKSEPQR